MKNAKTSTRLYSWLRAKQLPIKINYLYVLTSPLKRKFQVDSRERDLVIYLSLGFHIIYQYISKSKTHLDFHVQNFHTYDLHPVSRTGVIKYVRILSGFIFYEGSFFLRQTYVENIFVYV